MSGLVITRSMSKNDFLRDNQQILKKHKKVFHENYQRNFKQIV